MVIFIRKFIPSISEKHHKIVYLAEHFQMKNNISHIINLLAELK